MIECLKSEDIKAVSESMVNILENVTIGKHKEISDIKQVMMKNNALGSMMSGSGPTVFGLFKNKEDALIGKRIIKNINRCMLLIAVKKGLKFVENLTKLNLDNYKPLRDVVFENLREAILEGKLKPGQRLMEVQLAEQLGVSRTPVREAIRKLELEGLVVMLPRKGAYVANMSLKDIMDVLEVRASLEGLAAYLAAERISDEDIKKLKDISEEFKKHFGIRCRCVIKT